MKCLLVFVVYLASLFSNVCSLGLNITSLNGYTALVRWTREEYDPNPLTFDLRFVIPPYYDVGLAMADVSPGSVQSSGNITVQYPQDGTYMLIAVSGPNSFQIGRTVAIQVPGSITFSMPIPTPAPSLIPVPSPTPSQTPTPIPSSTTTPLPSKAFAAFIHQRPNVLAIVFGTLGGVLLIVAFTFSVLYVVRRRTVMDNRVSFHGERMVQQRSLDRSAGKGGTEGGIITPYPLNGSNPSLGKQSSLEVEVHDIEQGLAVPPPAVTSLPPMPPENRPSTPLPSGHIVPPPRGPRDRSKSIKLIEPSRMTRVDCEPTARQRQLADKLGEIEKQIEGIKSESKPSPSMVVILDDLEMQRAWLIKQRDSMWALEQIDTLPPGHSRYMA